LGEKNSKGQKNLETMRWKLL